MSKAEDKLENKRLKYIDYTFKRHGIDPDSKEGQLIYYAYGHGYYQAEKDNELTWKDLKLLQNISHGIFAETANGGAEFYQVYPTEQSFFEEILERFKEIKGNE